MGMDCSHLRWGKPFTSPNWYACPAGAGLQSPIGGVFVKKSAITSGGASLLENLVSTARRRGVPFTRVKGTKTRLGRCPKTPVAGCAGYGLILRREPKINPYCAQNRSQGSRRRICPFPPPPFPMAGKGPGWAGKCRAAVWRSGYVRACKNREPLTHGYG